VTRACQPRPFSLAWLVMLAPLFGAPAQAQSFTDFETIGRLEDARRQPSPLLPGQHSFEPSIVYKLFGVTTPHVFGASRIAYTDNYLRGDHDTPGLRLRREPLAEVTAGARLDTQLSDHRLELGYRASVTEAIDTGKLDTLEQDATARLDLYGTNVEAHADGFWTRSAYPQSVQLTGIVRLQTHGARAWGEVRFKRFGVRGGGSFTRFDYEQGEQDDLDSNNWGADLQVYWRFRAKVRFLVEYGWVAVNYDEGRQTGTLNDFEVHSIQAGVDGTVTPKLSASLKAGGAFQNVRHGPRPQTREYNGFVATMSLSYQPFARTTVVATYVHGVGQSTNSNFLVNDDVSLQITQVLYGEKITVSAGVDYTRSHVGPGDNINRFRANCSIEYKIRQWLSVIADYEFERSGSTFRDSDYRVHTAGISVGFGL